MYCKTCKYWKTPEQHENGFLVGVCSIQPFYPNEMEAFDMHCDNGEGAPIITGETFGCVNHSDLKGEGLKEKTAEVAEKFYNAAIKAFSK